MFRGQAVYVQYSNHPELKTEPSQHSAGVSFEFSPCTAVQGCALGASVSPDDIYF